MMFISVIPHFRNYEETDKSEGLKDRFSRPIDITPMNEYLLFADICVRNLHLNTDMRSYENIVKCMFVF